MIERRGWKAINTDPLRVETEDGNGAAVNKTYAKEA